MLLPSSVFLLPSIQFLLPSFQRGNGDDLLSTLLKYPVSTRREAGTMHITEAVMNRRPPVFYF